jgi:hypothetical protein
MTRFLLHAWWIVCANTFYAVCCHAQEVPAEERRRTTEHYSDSQAAFTANGTTNLYYETWTPKHIARIGAPEFIVSDDGVSWSMKSRIDLNIDRPAVMRDLDLATGGGYVEWLSENHFVNPRSHATLNDGVLHEYFAFNFAFDPAVLTAMDHSVTPYMFDGQSYLALEYVFQGMAPQPQQLVTIPEPTQFALLPVLTLAFLMRRR